MDLGPSSRPSFLANLHALPVELLAYIFTFCTQAPDKPTLSQAYRSSPVLLPITHVCHYWRAVALSHGPLWTSITHALSIRWIKACMERSQTILMDFDLQIIPYNHENIILLLSDFTRVGSLGLKGSRSTIRPVLDSLCNSLPIHSFSLELGDHVHWHERFILSDDLFGGNAPVRHIRFDANCRIVVPHQLLRSVTHFTTTEPFPPPELVNVLRQMPAVVYLDLLIWNAFDEDRVLPVQLPRLVNLIGRTGSFVRHFLVLDRLLLLHPGAKRRFEMNLSEFCSWIAYFEDWTGLSQLLEAVGGIQHIHFSGDYWKGWFRMWTGSATTTWEDAELCLFAGWNLNQSFGHADVHKRQEFVQACVALGVARARRLVIHLTAVDWWKFVFKNRQCDLSTAYWWDLLGKLPGIEGLELHPTGVHESGGGVWKVSTAPALLPALRRVRIVVSEFESAQYAIIGDTPARRIVWLTEDDITSFPEAAASAEKELEDFSSGLLTFLQGLAGVPHIAIQ